MTLCQAGPRGDRRQDRARDWGRCGDRSGEVRGLAWLGVRTDRFAEMVELYRDIMGLEPYHEDERSVQFRLASGTEIHVYGPADRDHEFFGRAPVVGLLVEDHDEVRRRLEAAGIEFLTPVERADGSSWSHFRGPDGNVRSSAVPASGGGAVQVR